MHPLVLLIGYLAVGLAPLVLSALQGLPRRPFWDEVSSGLAMVAFAVMLTEFVLSGRFRLISGRIGMDVTMRLHQLLARTALVFVLVHPFLYQTPLNPPLPWDTAARHGIGLDFASLATGLIGWVGLAALVLKAIFRNQLPYRYETWRLMHGLGAVLIAAAVTHHTFAAGRYSADMVLAGFWALLLVAALGSLARTYVVTPLRKARHPYEVISVAKIALKTWALTLRPKKREALAFEAGQFVWLNLGHGPFSLGENPFSIAFAPATRPEIQFIIKEVGDMTRAVGAVTPGTTAYLDGPHGTLTLAGREGKGIALIAGGVGIAPLISIARQLDADNDPRPIVLLYGNRVADQIVYEDELNGMAARRDMEVIHILSEPPPGWTGLTGLVDGAVIQKLFSADGAADWLYFVCGPPAMIDIVEDNLIALGVPAKQIVTERFYYD